MNVKVKLIFFNFLIIFNSCYCHELNKPASYYTAAVAEIQIIGCDLKDTITYTNQMVDIINSPDVKEAEIVVLPEAILNNDTSPILQPASTNFCNDPNAHYVFRNISCAARDARKYVVINVYTKIKCADDDQPFCGNKEDNSNVYNTAWVFDRFGTTIARYRKFHPIGEQVQNTVKPELITFRTDFNVTFGIAVCFDLIFDTPMIELRRQGVRNFVFTTMWNAELPYTAALQYQQMWAYANNVNFLAANANWHDYQSSGTGIYAGRLGALKTFVDSQVEQTRVLVAKVPIQLPSDDYIETELQSESIANDFTKTDAHKLRNDITARMRSNAEPEYDKYVLQQNMTSFAVEFLDFSERTNYNGTVCKNGLCCHYDIDISYNGVQDDNLPTYAYGISVFNGYRSYSPDQRLLNEQICSLIACGEMDDRHTCGKRYVNDVQHRYTIKKLHLHAEIPVEHASSIMPGTVKYDLYPLNVREFEFHVSKLDGEQKYAVTFDLKVPKSDLLTFAIFTRNYLNDIHTPN